MSTLEEMLSEMWRATPLIKRPLLVVVTCIDKTTGLYSYVTQQSGGAATSVKRHSAVQYLLDTGTATHNIRCRRKTQYRRRYRKPV